MTLDPVASARATLDELARAWRARYGDAVLDVDVTAAGEGAVRVAGHVLVPSQRAALERALRGALEAAGGAALVVDVEALTSREASAGWARPLEGRAAVRARPAPDADLATELAADDPPARVLSERGAWSAVELADRTVGWMAVADLGPAPPPASVAAWRARWVGVAREAPDGAWARAAAAWLHAPYRLGGNSREGIDCSALTQRLYRAVLGIGLPRHSSDQARFGRRVGRGELAPGDLVHLTHVERGTSHVAVVLDRAPLRVVHASLDHGAVVVEPLDDLLARYALRACRRFPPGAVPAAA